MNRDHARPPPAGWVPSPSARSATTSKSIGTEPHPDRYDTPLPAFPMSPQGAFGSCFRTTGICQRAASPLSASKSKDLTMIINPIRITQTLMAAGAIGLAIGCASSGPPQISEQNRELCFQNAAGLNYSAYANNAQEAAALAEGLAAAGQNIAAGEAAEYARQQADEADAIRQNISDGQRRGNLDAADFRRSARACQSIAEDYAKYAERLAGQ